MHLKSRQYTSIPKISKTKWLYLLRFHNLKSIYFLLIDLSIMGRWVPVELNQRAKLELNKRVLRMLLWSITQISLQFQIQASCQITSTCPRFLTYSSWSIRAKIWMSNLTNTRTKGKHSLCFICLDLKLIRTP